MNKKGFSFIELLAVIVLLGILSGIAIFGVSRYLDNSRKDIYLAAVHAQVKAVKLIINSEDYYVYDEDTTYIFDVNILKQTDDIKSPYGEWENAYTYVVYEDDKLYFYWTGIDEKGWKIDLEKETQYLKRSDIYNTKTGGAPRGVAIGDRKNVVFYEVNKDGNEIEKAGDLAYNVKKEEADKCYEYELMDDNTYRITNYNISCGTTVNIPSAIDGRTVTKIGPNSFREKELTKIALYNGIKEIELGAFQGNKINSLSLPISLETIGSYAFYKNKIKEVKFPEELKVIGSWSFANNKLTKVVIPKSVTTIGDYAFYGNLIEDFELKSNPALGGAAFSNNKVPSSKGIIYRYDSEKQEIDYSTIIGYCSDSKDLVIPAEVNGVAPKIIKENAFASTKITSVQMPDSIITIEPTAFAFNNLTSVKLSNSLQTIGTGAFRSNYLETINIPDSVINIGNYAFVKNNIKDENGDCRIIYNRTPSGIDYSTIVSYGCGREPNELVIPASKNGIKLKLIKKSAFSDSKIRKITFPDLSETDSLTIENNAFVRNMVSGEDGFIYRIANGKINYTYLSSYAGPTGGQNGTITIPQKKNNINLKTISASFTWMDYKTVIVPKTVTKIANGVFARGNRNNVNLDTIVNLTGKSFDWYKITSSTLSNPGPFITGNISHQSGNIKVVGE